MIITHYDADGKACLVLAKKYMNGIGRYTVCDYSNINQTVNSYLDNVENFKNDDLVLVITDISVSKETAKRIESMKYMFNFLMLIDHHPGNNYYLKNYDWCKLYDEDTSATKALYDYLKETSVIAPNDNEYDEFVKAVNDLDTWNDEDNPNAKIVYDLSNNLKTHNFVNRFKVNASFSLSKNEKMILGMREDDIDSTISKIKPIIKGGTCFIFADRYITEITEHIFSTYRSVNMITIVNTTSQSVSYRSRSDRYDVSEIANKNGGRGSKTSSGNSISDDKMEKILDILLEDGVRDYTREGSAVGTR
jgi:oligoribonuclease NrnB/cAMP/cGMP phosphodiesterase (DHH superfamily)